MKKFKDLLDHLQTRGHRLTAARKAILEILSKTQTPLTTKEIHEKLQKQSLSTDKVTVYREIDFLTKENLIEEVHFHDRHKRYELASLEHHHHLICQKCDKVEDISLKEDFESQTKSIERKMKFKILRHSLEFFGLCQTCQ